MNNKASSILQNAMALLLTASAALCLCLLTGCSHEELPETGKYNTMIVLRGDGTKALEPDEAQSIVIYAFSSDNDLVGYLYEDNINGRDIFPMNLTAGGEIDFYVILNPFCSGFEIIDEKNKAVTFASHEGITPDIIKSWKLQRTDDTPDKAVPMSNLEDQVDGNHNPTGKSNRRFEVVANRNSWQEIPIQVTRAVSKVEVWFWANDDLPESGYYQNGNHYSSIDAMTLKDPVVRAELMEGQNSVKAEDYIEENKAIIIKNPDRYDGFNDRFKPYDSGIFYSDRYFRKIWEQYILPNTFFGGSNVGEIGGADADYLKCTSLNVEYTEHYWNWNWNRWTESPQTPKDIYLPISPRNTIIKVWCALNDDTDRSFTYTVVDWDEETIDIPAFD